MSSAKCYPFHCGLNVLISHETFSILQSLSIIVIILGHCHYKLYRYLSNMSMISIRWTVFPLFWKKSDADLRRQPMQSLVHIMACRLLGTNPIISSHNSLAPVRHQPIIWTNTVLSIGFLATKNYIRNSNIFIQENTFEDVGHLVSASVCQVNPTCVSVSEEGGKLNNYFFTGMSPSSNFSLNVYFSIRYVLDVHSLHRIHARSS